MSTLNSVDCQHERQVQTGFPLGVERGVGMARSAASHLNSTLTTFTLNHKRHRHTLAVFGKFCPEIAIV